MNIAFAGFRHDHVHALWNAAVQAPRLTVLGGWEADDRARAMAQARGVSFSYATFQDILSDPKVDIVALGDCYGKRGAQAIQALRAGKHIYADKPLCTRLEELDQIEALSREKRLCVGCMLPLRYSGYAQIVRKLLRQPEWGQVRCAMFTGQHPLMYGTRPQWYFEEGMHGGVITDIAIHGIDLIRYLTGQEIAQVNFARDWNAFAQEAPNFRDCAQFACALENGAGILADVSYASPDSFGYGLESYWQFQLWADGGKIEFGENMGEIRLYKKGDSQCRHLPAGESAGDCMEDLLREIQGQTPIVQTTRDVIGSMRAVLKIQAKAGEAEK